MQRILPALALLLALCLPCLASGEITATDATGQTLYAVEYLGAQVMTASTGALAAESDASWGTYAIPLTEIGTTGTYVGSEPTGAAAGKYVVAVYEEATPGTVSLANDTRVALGSLEWSGTAQVTLVSVNTQSVANLTATNANGAAIAGLGTSIAALPTASVIAGAVKAGSAPAWYAAPGASYTPSQIVSALMLYSLGHSLTFGQLQVLQQASLLGAVLNTWNAGSHTLTTAYTLSGDPTPLLTNATVYPVTQILPPGVTSRTTTPGAVPQP